MKHSLFLALCIGSSSLFAQQTIPYRVTYDDSTLQQQGPLTLMPFNRLVKSAGKVVTYGDSAQENHALDFAVLPGGKNIVVEDRYGIAVLGVGARQIKQRWSFDQDASVRGLMSTY